MMICFWTPICRRYARISSVTEIAEHVLPVPSPWKSSSPLYGVWNERKFLTKPWCGRSSNSLSPQSWSARASRS